jgi:regulator of sigma E protease
VGLHLIAGLLLADMSFLTGVLNTAYNVFQVAFGLGMVIFVHELGHFLVAKACGVKCEKFYVGFDIPIAIGPIRLPAALLKFQWGETEYGIGIIPLGGYVKMLGQDDNPANAEAEAARTRVADTAGEKTADAVLDTAEGAASAVPPARDEQKIQQTPLDPRSFPAKSVPQRMAIISAGVIMNLIFAVVFATIAYRIGVPYTPTEIGGLTPGGPAWVADLQPGDRIIQLGRSGNPNRRLRFIYDLTNYVAVSGGPSDPIDLLIERPEQPPFWVTITPSTELFKEADIPMIGVAPASEPILGEKPVIEDFPAARAKTPFKANDRIVAVVVDGMRREVPDFYAFQAVTVQHAAKRLAIVVARPTEAVAATAGDVAAMEEVTIEVEPTRLRTFGFVTEIGPVVAVRKNSPAEAAGIQAGDILRAIDGRPIGNPILLSTALVPLADKEVEIEVDRVVDGKTSRLTLPITPRLPRLYEFATGLDEPIGVDSLGIACEVSAVVARVDGDPAQSAGIQPGDIVRSVQFIPASEKAKKDEDARKLNNEPIDLVENSRSWPAVLSRLQLSRADTSVRLTIERKRQIMVVNLRPVDSADEFFPARGISLSRKVELHQVQSWSEATVLGFRATWESVGKVVVFLKRVFTGHVSPKHVGGPILIVATTASEAAQGWGTLLLFLTLLSANLAVVNFLPIPVLDGGHMMFLIYEGLRGRPVDEKWAFRLTVTGLFFILGLMVSVLLLDVYRLAVMFGGG